MKIEYLEWSPNALEDQKRIHTKQYKTFERDDCMRKNGLYPINALYSYATKLSGHLSFSKFIILSEGTQVDSVIEYNLSFPLSPDIIAHLDESTAKYSTEHSGSPHYWIHFVTSYFACKYSSHS